jgi:RNA polymerase sigma-70 factor (ECF subfamily)
MSLLSTAGNNCAIEEKTTERCDAMLVSSAKSGDADAFVELSKRHYRRVLQAAYRITGNRQDAEDALQESLLQAFSHLQRFEEKCSFSTWLTRIAMNSALMILRKRRRRSEVSIDGTDAPDDKSERWVLKALTEDPESHYARREREDLLRKAIPRLHPVVREVLELRQARGYSVREIARALEISEPAVKSRLNRAKVTLRSVLQHRDVCRDGLSVQGSQ